MPLMKGWCLYARVSITHSKIQRFNNYLQGREKATRVLLLLLCIYVCIQAVRPKWLSMADLSYPGFPHKQPQMVSYPWIASQQAMPGYDQFSEQGVSLVIYLKIQLMLFNLTAISRTFGEWSWLCHPTTLLHHCLANGEHWPLEH